MTLHRQKNRLTGEAVTYFETFWMGFFKIPSFFDAFLTGTDERKTYKQGNTMEHRLYLTKIKP